MIRKFLAAMLFTAVLAATPALAMDQELVLRCVLRETLAAINCKSPEDFRFVGRRDEVYVFNTHYAAQFTEFYCQVFDKDVVITCKTWHGKMASARLNFESQPGCISATVNSPDASECRVSRIVQCCGTD